jgi:hypothetical protein
LEESVLEVVFQSLLDDMEYPRRSTEGDEEEYVREYAVAQVDDRSALEQLRRRARRRETGGEHSRRGYSVPDTLMRPKAEEVSN